MTTAIGTTDVDICSRALVLLGNKPVDDLDGTDDKTVACKNVYALVRDTVLTHHPWRFTIAKFQLAKLTAAPINEYQFGWQLPAKRINSSPFEPLIVDIQVDQVEARWPPHVVTFATFVMAALLAEAVTDQTDKAKMWHTTAWGTAADDMKGGFSRTARVQDGQGRPTPAIEDYSLINVRVS